MIRYPRATAFILACGLLSPAVARAAGVTASFDPNDPRRGPFPSDRFTVLDLTQKTLRRVNLPKPPCSVQPSDCANIDVVNTLDGFNLQPRISIPFDGPIDVSTVSSQTVFLVSLGSTTGGGSFGHVVGINQIVWDPVTFTLHAESDELLDQHTRYLLIATSGIHDAAGQPVRAAQSFLRVRGGRSVAADTRDLIDGARLAGVQQQQVIAASLFTTQSATAILERVRGQIKAAQPAPADFVLGADGSRTVFPASAVTGIVFNRQIGATTFVPVPVPTAALGIVPGAVGRVAFGKYASPDYETAGGFIPAIGTRRGVPAVQRVSDVHFTVFLPAGPQPPHGWPVALFGHGFGDNKNNSPFAVAAILASRGVATAAINVVGHGGGPAGTLQVALTGGTTVTLPAGGRSVDQNGDTLFGATEGSSAVPPQTIISSRDGLRQTAIDLMQLVRQIETGVDVDGDGQGDLDASRIYYFGQSFGGIYGTTFLAVEPSVRAGVINVGGGSITEVSRLGVFRPALGALLAAQVPSLLNLPDLPGSFNENGPLRDQPAVVDTVPGAAAIQEFLDRMEWVSQAGNPVAYAPHVRTSPLAGVSPKSVIFQFAKGDKTVPNPTNTAILRAGDLADRATYFRNDLAFAANPAAVPKDPHAFLTRIVGAPSVVAVAAGAQQQIAAFFASDGALVIDPDGAGPLFEVPIVLPLPEDLSFIP
jgi:hypothetical protein